MGKGCGVAAASGTGANVPRSRIRNGGRHRCQPPLSGPVPRPAIPLHPGPLLLRSAARKTMRCGARRNNPATVWSAPFRGPAAPGKPFIISSGRLPKRLPFSSDGLLSRTRSGSPQLVGIAAFRDLAIGCLPRRPSPVSSGQSCNCPSRPGGPSSPASDDLKLSRTRDAANRKCT